MIINHSGTRPEAALEAVRAIGPERAESAAADVADGASVKAMLDGICYEVRLNLESMSSAGIEIAALRSIGGGTRSERWMQLKADITGIPVEVTEVTEAGCLGAAFLAGLGSGVYGSPTDISDIVTVKKTFEPRVEQKRAYDEHYELYLELRERVKGLEI